MDITAFAAGIGILCVLPVGSAQTPAPRSGAPAFVIAGAGDSGSAFELLHSIDVAFTMDGPKLSLAPGHQTLVIVPGSVADDEDLTGRLVNRIRQLIGQARKTNASVVLLHLGGRRSRNASSSSHADDSNRLAADAADHIIVAGDGNFDGFLRPGQRSAGFRSKSSPGFPRLAPR